MAQRKLQIAEEDVQDFRPIRIKVDQHVVDPDDVSSIRSVKKGTLFIIKLKSDPNPQYPLWANPEDILGLLACFNVM